MPYTAPIAIRNDLVAAKLETTYGTDAVPSPTVNAVRISKRAWSSITPGYEWPILRDDVANQSFIPIQAAAAHGQKAPLSLMWELNALGTTSTTPALPAPPPLSPPPCA